MTAPRQPHARAEMRRVLFAAALLLCCAAVLPAAGHRCVFDRMAKRAGPPSTAVVLELPRRGRSGVSLVTASGPESNWAPIRIFVSTKDLEDETRYCTDEDQWRSAYDGSYAFCKQRDVLTEEKRKAIMGEIIPQAVKLHAERLRVQPIVGHILVPNYTSSYCSYFTIPSEHHTEGVDKADMVMYAAVGITHNNVNAWAIGCSTIMDGRPVIGAITLSARSATILEESVRTAAHEIAHALGFDFDLFVQRRMVTPAADVRGKPVVLLVNSPKTLKKAQAHYNCPTALGMELEDEGGEGTAGSHWEMRNAKDELMSGTTGIGYYTALTMATFEDLGFYRVNWSMAETMNWGKNSGCRLLTEKCLTNGITAYPDMFCSKPTTDITSMLCTSDRRALGSCSIYSYQNLPPHLQYFGQPELGGKDTSLTDLCPVIKPYSDTICADSSFSNVPGSRGGSKSRCLKGSELQYRGTNIGDVCAEVQCNEESHTVSVRYLGNDTWHECSEGNHIEPRGDFSGGKILCPKYSEVCIETGADNSGVDVNPTKVDSSVTPAEEKGDALHPVGEGPQKDVNVKGASNLPGEKNEELQGKGEAVSVKSEPNETEYPSTTAGADMQEVPSAKDAFSNFSADTVLNKLHGDGMGVGDKDGSISAGFHAPLFLLLTALSLTALC